MLPVPVGIAGLTLGAQQPKKASPDKARIMGSNLNFADMWGRVYLARLCSALIFAEWTSTQTFVEGLGAPFLKMLVALATRQVLKGCAAPLDWGNGCNLLRLPASQTSTSCSW